MSDSSFSFIIASVWTQSKGYKTNSKNIISFDFNRRIKATFKGARETTVVYIYIYIKMNII